MSADLCQDPVPPNGRIKRFDLRIQELGDRRRDNVKNASAASESVYVNRSRGDDGAARREITAIKEMELADSKAVKVFVAAVNAVGRSPEAELAVSTKAYREWLCECAVRRRRVAVFHGCECAIGGRGRKTSSVKGVSVCPPQNSRR